LTPADDRPTGDTGSHPTPAAAQSSAKRFMQFSGEPFPGFEDDGTPARGGPAWGPTQDVEIEELTDDILDDPARGI
jgi:hypothetical protein